MAKSSMMSQEACRRRIGVEFDAAVCLINSSSNKLILTPSPDNSCRPDRLSPCSYILHHEDRPDCTLSRERLRSRAQTRCDGTEPEKWYPSGNAGDWTNGYCKFERQCYGRYGSGYATELACCNGFFGGQMSGECVSRFANPPTTFPTLSGGLAGFWYPDYDTAWPDAGCLDTLPLALPYANANDRPTYSTRLECCKGAYGGQSSGKCLSELANPPTTSPTLSGGMAGFW